MASAQDLVTGREFVGWKLGLERMRRLCSLLGMPQHRFASVHVVGTNGKTSVARMTAELIEAHGHAAGAYLSPHIHDWRERVLIGGEPISEAAFADALERAEQAAEVADRTGADDDGPITQFELLTAAAFVGLAAAKVKFAVIEAGLGGRLDATNVIPSTATVLTSVGLDHTEYLGDTLEAIAAEKLAVLRDQTTLVHGPVPPEVSPVISREVERHHARVMEVAADAPGSEALPTAYQRANWSLAVAATQAALGGVDPARVLEVAERGPRPAPGRAQVLDGDPPLIFDAAHNPDGARALAEALPALAGGREVVCCLAVLSDKDAAGIVAPLARACSAIVCAEVPPEAIAGTGRPGTTSLPAAELAALARGAGADAEAVADPDEAWGRARELARERGGAALAAGSHYLLKCLWTERPAESC